MNHFWFGAIGVGVAIVGVLLLIFNRQFFDVIPAPKPPAADFQMFQPGPTGRVPILTFVSAGWVVIGCVFLSVAITNQPL